MRIWSLHPTLLDTKGLVALWREALLAKHVLSGSTIGYQNHPQLKRFKSSPNPHAAKYNKHFLDFLTYTFATATIIAYCLYSYIEQTPQVSTAVNTFVASIIPGIENRKLMTATIPVVVYAIARYGQLFYTRVQGERPETLIVTDVPLAGTMIIWAIMTVSIIYLL
jgi:hypothetical protein